MVFRIWVLGGFLVLGMRVILMVLPLGSFTTPELDSLPTMTIALSMVSRGVWPFCKFNEVTRRNAGSMNPLNQL